MARTKPLKIRFSVDGLHQAITAFKRLEGEEVKRIDRFQRIKGKVVSVRAVNRRQLARLEKAEKRFSYTAVEALNEATKTSQQAVLLKVLKKFTVRTHFLTGTLDKLGGAAGKITQFASATKAIPYSELTAGLPPLEGREGRKAPVLVPMYEEGDLRFPTGNKGSVAVPQKLARPTKQSLIVDKFLFSHMAIRQKGDRWEGRDNTFILRSRKGTGVYVRLGPGRKEIRIVWRFVPYVTLRRRVFFFRTAIAAFKKAFPLEFKKQIAVTLDYQARRTL